MHYLRRKTKARSPITTAPSINKNNNSATPPKSDVVAIAPIKTIAKKTGVMRLLMIFPPIAK
ncbi:hypothetical protein D0B88_18480 [Cellvibrio sp. KY-YJ-3]|nr:hypothetical protein D0B88_18480 [Cellvibrio sp. KY-YJ-3]